MDNNKHFKIGAAALCAAAIVAIIAMVIISGKRNATASEHTLNTTVMGTTATLTVYGADGSEIIDDIMKLEKNLDENVISWRKENSEVWTINHNYKAGVDYPVSDELGKILGQTLAISKDNGDLLDITIRPLAETWGIESGSTDIPSRSDIEAALAKVDVTQVTFKEAMREEDKNDKTDPASKAVNSVNIAKDGMSLDFGSVGKGYGCDIAAEYLTGSTATGACIALGGSILVYGSKPDGSAWKIGVKNPREGDAGSSGSVMGVISAKTSDTLFISTSGDYEKYFEKDGKRYHHILDPKTGYPAWKHTIAATVVCDNGLVSDALSTLCMLLDREKAMETVRKYGAEAILIDDQKNVYVSDGLRDSFSLSGTDYRMADRP